MEHVRLFASTRCVVPTREHPGVVRDWVPVGGGEVERKVVAVDIAAQSTIHRSHVSLDGRSGDTVPGRERTHTIDLIQHLTAERQVVPRRAHRDDVQATQPSLRCESLEPADRSGRLRNLTQAVEHEQRLPGDCDVAGVTHSRFDVCEEPFLPAARVTLRQKHVVVESVPTSRPRFVRPVQREPHVDAGIVEQVAQRAVQDLVTGEPVVVEDEPVDPVVTRELSLGLDHQRVAQVVLTQCGIGEIRLLVAFEQRLRLSDIDPVGEAVPPEPVVLRDAVKLRVVERVDRRRVQSVRGRSAPFRHRQRVDDVQPGRLAHDAYHALERVGVGSIQLSALHLEGGDTQVEINESLEEPRPAPEHGSGRER